MRVFVSSTVYDLLDVRAEIADLLRSCGISPVLSDDKLSDFTLSPDKNSIETCLVNVDTCDEMILILDKRYGPRLGKCGFEDVSATHLEYRRFMQNRRGRPIQFFVRDRLEGDYTIWKQNGKKTDIDFAWVKQKEDHPLFNFLDERRKLTAGDKSNWITPFSSSSDLKASLAKHFDETFLPQRLADAIYNNTFPLFHLTTESSQVGQSITVEIQATNQGTTTALNTLFYFAEEKAEKEDTKSFVAPKQMIQRTIALRNPYVPSSVSVFLEYESRIGVKVFDEYTIDATYLGHGILTKCALKSRRFVKGQTETITISEN